ncbi:MAG: peptidase domain-containing ABC transporter [Chiayiivirga sp.]|uniref:peptidase domain-containing ABC transporter n=1 Tax=Chiayiivirga sp. TaxID=2041042 RepID=UPI0025BAD231|nr:peptidase domain-containing ABC transporter [Chiayiivirga sp.]MCI1711093.1 peptidase domain-containing ABC transporter [Chiayiivirga sp.]MCI1728109.1 peptidase domain-containing ABC transporter [Chiayiivirga sp.]
MKSILQSEAAECGLACLAMVAEAHELRLGLPELRRRFSLSLKGAKLNHLIHVAQQLGFQSRALRLDLDDIPKLKLPCILHWDLNHFVVLAKADKRQATVLDPAFGERRVDYAELSRHFTGVALELTPTTGFQPRRAAPSISARQLAGPVRGLWRALGQILALSLALQVFVLLAPFLMQWVVDQVLVSADQDLLTVLGLGFGLALLLQIGIGLLRGWSVVYLSSRLGLQWMGNVFAHLMRLPLEFFEKRHLGDITSRLGSIGTIQKTLTTSFVEALIDGVMAMATFALMLVYSWKLATVTVGAVGLYLGIRALAYRPVRDRVERQLVAAAKQQSHLLESLRGMQSLKVAGHESQRRASYDNLMVETVNGEVRLARLNLGFSGASQLVFGIERIAVIWIGALLALQNVFSVGMLIAYLAYKDQFAQRTAALIDKWIEFRMLRLHGERLADIVLTEPEVDAASAFEAAPPTDVRIEVDNLSFRYAEGEPWVLRECSFSIAPGESVAIIGPSGCGKTTLMKLMLGLLTPSDGSIRIGGKDIRTLGKRNVRAMVGAVMQDDQLFAGSLADNIGLFDNEFDLARIEAAARLAAVHEDIAAMPMGYHSLIGDMGSSLSGGQKQRVILARALYRHPKLLFLDEATSHLDVMRERQVNAAVRKLALTKVIVAHRPETIASADRVLVMEGGRVVRSFTPDIRATRQPTPSEAA